MDLNYVGVEGVHGILPVKDRLQQWYLWTRRSAALFYKNFL